MRIALTLLLTVFAFNSNAQAIYFNRLYGNDALAEAGFALCLADTNYFITGVAQSLNLSFRGIETICLNEKGDTVWSKEDTLNYPVSFDIETYNNNIYEIGNAEFYNPIDRQTFFF